MKKSPKKTKSVQKKKVTNVKVKIEKGIKLTRGGALNFDGDGVYC